jgi:hypothetical protein
MSGRSVPPPILPTVARDVSTPDSLAAVWVSQWTVVTQFIAMIAKHFSGGLLPQLSTWSLSWRCDES